MKSPHEYPLIHFRAGKLTNELSARASEQSNSGYSEVAKQDLSDYYKLLRLCLPTFEPYEQHALYEGLNGWNVTPQTVHLLYAEMETYFLAYKISGYEAFIERLRALSRFECWCIIDAVQHGFPES